MDSGETNPKINTVIMVDLIDVQPHVLAQTLRQTAKFPIKIIAATEEENAVYAKEREKLEK